MLTIARFGLALLVGIATFYFVFWLPMSLLSFLPGHMLIAFVGSFAAGIWAGRFIWRRTQDGGGVLTMTFGGAMIVGTIGFLSGFFGPMIWAPDANQGPLLGIFYTGPLGFLLGGACGFVYGLARRYTQQRAT